MNRRAVLAAGLALATVPARRGMTADSPFSDGADLLVAGPAGGRLDGVAKMLQPALAPGLPDGVVMRLEPVGGPDGVTGANQFETRDAPDGASILLMPGEAALAWLVGDPRARFNAGTFVPVMAGVAPGVLMSRRPLDAADTAAHLRIVAGRPDGPGLAGLLALDLLGRRPQPAFGFPDPAAVEQIILANGADAAFVVGPDAPQRVGRLTIAGLAPVFTLGVPGDDGAVLRDPLLPEVPTLPELAARLRGARPAGPLYDAWRAVAAAAQLTFLLALPAVTPGALVSLWREAAVHAGQRLAPGGAIAASVLVCPEASRFAAPIVSADAATLLELRRWLAMRLGWQPA